MPSSPNTSASATTPTGVELPKEIEDFVAAAESIIADCWGLTYKSVVHPYEGTLDAPPSFDARPVRPPLPPPERQPTREATLTQLYQDNLQLLFQITLGEAELVHCKGIATSSTSSTTMLQR